MTAEYLVGALVLAWSKIERLLFLDVHRGKWNHRSFEAPETWEPEGRSGKMLNQWRNRMLGHVAGGPLTKDVEAIYQRLKAIAPMRHDLAHNVRMITQDEKGAPLFLTSKEMTNDQRSAATQSYLKEARGVFRRFQSSHERRHLEMQKLRDRKLVARQYSAGEVAEAIEALQALEGEMGRLHWDTVDFMAGEYRPRKDGSQ